MLAAYGSVITIMMVDCSRYYRLWFVKLKCSKPHWCGVKLGFGAPAQRKHRSEYSTLVEYVIVWIGMALWFRVHATLSIAVQCSIVWQVWGPGTTHGSVSTNMNPSYFIDIALPIGALQSTVFHYCILLYSMYEVLPSSMLALIWTPHIALI